MDSLELLQKEPEARDDESESHQGEARANPRKKSSLGSQIIPQVGSFELFRWRIHVLPRCEFVIRLCIHDAFVWDIHYSNAN